MLLDKVKQRKNITFLVKMKGKNTAGTSSFLHELCAEDGS
jgi:hypothetical protein